MTDKPAIAGPGLAGEDHEYYAEPATLTGRDTAGIVVALCALLLIGVGGYIWLTPGMSLARLFSRGAASQRPPSQHTDQLPPTEKEPSSSATSDHLAAGEATSAGKTEERALLSSAPTKELLAAANGDRSASCPRCGMFAGKSYTEVVAQWADGSITHHDSWVCVFGWAKDKGLTLKNAAVLEHGATPAAPKWLAASSAAFVYDTKSIKGSMSPFVAAFATKEAASSAQTSDGGQLTDWEGLKQKFK